MLLVEDCLRFMVSESTVSLFISFFIGTKLTTEKVVHIVKEVFHNLLRELKVKMNYPKENEYVYTTK